MSIQCEIDFHNLHRGQKVFLGDEPILENCKYLRAAIVQHNWPSQWHSRFPGGYVSLCIVRGEKTYRKYFDLQSQTVNEKPRYTFAATKEAEKIYLVKCAAEEELVEKSTTLIAEGKEMYANGNLWGAVRKYEEATRFDPSNVEAYSRLGHTFLKLGLYRDALGPLNHALTLTRDVQLRSRIYDDIGVAKSNSGNQAEALSSFGLSLKSKPVNPKALVHRAVSHSRTGQHDQAYTDVLMALKLRPGYLPALHLKTKLEVSGRIPPLGATLEENATR